MFQAKTYTTYIMCISLTSSFNVTLNIYIYKVGLDITNPRYNEHLANELHSVSLRFYLTKLS